MKQIAPRTLSGFMELLPGDQAQMEKMMETLRRSYSLYGFTPLDTPVIEAAEILLAKGGGETEKQIYRFTKGDTDLALRFDLTVLCFTVPIVASRFFHPLAALIEKVTTAGVDWHRADAPDELASAEDEIMSLVDGADEDGEDGLEKEEKQMMGMETEWTAQGAATALGEWRSVIT